jgi:hypothetical protein
MDGGCDDGGMSSSSSSSSSGSSSGSSTGSSSGSNGGSSGAPIPDGGNLSPGVPLVPDGPGCLDSLCGGCVDDPSCDDNQQDYGDCGCTPNPPPTREAGPNL